MYRLTSSAEADLDIIYEDGFVRFGERAADEYAKRITRTLQLIGSQPRRARERREYARSIRVQPVGQHLILYAVEGAGALNLRVRHGREDWQADLASDNEA